MLKIITKIVVTIRNWILIGIGYVIGFGLGLYLSIKNFKKIKYMESKEDWIDLILKDLYKII